MMKVGVRENLAEAGVDLSSLNLDSVVSSLTNPIDGLKLKHFLRKVFHTKSRTNSKFCGTSSMTIL